MRTDSGSNILPTALKRSISPPSPPTPRVWAMASGKGGVGKSLLTANLGCLLAESDWPALLLDLDLQGANLHTFLGKPASLHGLDSILGGNPIENAICSHDVPGLSYIPGSVIGTHPTALSKGHPSSEAGTHWGANLLASVKSQQVREVLVDLQTGHNTWALDFFAQADVPILVLTPDPPAVENTHRFLRQAWLRGVERYLISLKDPDVSPKQRLALAVDELGNNSRPEALLAWLRKKGIPLGAEQSVPSFFGVMPHIVVNQVTHQNDVDMGFFFVRAVQDYFSMTMRFLGSVKYDKGVRLTTRRRHLHLRGPSEECLSEGLSQIADHVVEGGFLSPSHL